MVATLGKACVIPLVTKYFQFPGDAYYSTVLPSIYGDHFKVPRVGTQGVFTVQNKRFLQYQQ
eukprot:5873478-Amphidinium_carterae.1